MHSPLPDTQEVDLETSLQDTETTVGFRSQRGHLAATAAAAVV